jgi:integrase
MQSQPNQSSARQPKRVRIAPNIYARGGRFECGYTGTDGRWHIVTLKGAQNLTQAKRAAREILSKRDTSQDVTPSRLTLGEIAAEYFQMIESLVASGERSERTREIYCQQYRTHVQERLGRVRVQAVTPRHVQDILAHVRQKRVKRGREREGRPLSPSTVDGVFRVLDLILGFAVTRGYRADNPVDRLSKAEKPKRRNVSSARVLTREEIARLIESALPTYRPLISTLAYSGLRLSEALGLTWPEIDFEADEIHVRHQLSKATRERPAFRKPLKTDAARRDVVLLPQLATILKGHRKELLAAGLYRADGYVFCTQSGAPMYCRNVAERGVGKAADRAGLNPDSKPRLTAHDLRHTFASHLIRAGADVYSVARQLGHSRASVTLDVYAHEFEKVRNGKALRQQLATAFRHQI